MIPIRSLPSKHFSIQNKKIENLLKTGNFSDLTISEFKVHKPILGIRCPKILEIDFSNFFHEKEIFFQFFEFIYKNKFDEEKLNDKILLKLLELSKVKRKERNHVSFLDVYSFSPSVSSIISSLV